MNYTPRVRVKLVREGPPGRALNSPREVFELVRGDLEDADREHFLVVHLSTKNTVNGVETVSIGTLDGSMVHPREVFKGAILNSAASVILVHNHPSGNPEPSPDDLNLTKRLKEAGNILGIEVLDHIVVGKGRYLSFKDRCLI
jgi:DNA repair protein RadC